MSVSEQDVAHVAELANLELTDSEKSAMLRDLNAVLGYFAQLNELDTTSVAPMTQVFAAETESGEPAANASSLRADEVAPSLSRQQVLASAPDTDGAFFRVPKVIER
jgi:aspartyl-tRNA(Asn)/glutamyl-tRNA(Gln) amidotransferase subunit C